MLNIKHHRPEIQFYTGKWVVKDEGITAFIQKGSERFYIQLTEEAEKHIYSTVIKRKKVVGTYSPRELSIMYFVDIDTSGLTLSSSLKFPDLIIGSIGSDENLLTPVNILKI